MNLESNETMTVDTIIEKYGVVLEHDGEKIKEKIQAALDAGVTEFRVAKFVGSATDDDAKVSAALNLQPGEQELGMWSGHQGKDDNSEWFVLVAKTNL